MTYPTHGSEPTPTPVPFPAPEPTPEPTPEPMVAPEPTPERTLFAEPEPVHTASGSEVTPPQGEAIDGDDGSDLDEDPAESELAAEVEALVRAARGVTPVPPPHLADVDPPPTPEVATTERVAAEAVAPQVVAPQVVAPEVVEATEVTEVVEATWDGHQPVVPVEVVPAGLTAVPPVPSPKRAGPLVPVLAALVLVLAGLTGFLAWQAKEASGQLPVERSRSEALAAARDAARTVFSYDYRKLDKDFAAGRALTTGEFRKEYDRTTKKLVDDVAPRLKAVVGADVSEASVVRASEDEVVCLVFVNQQSTSSLMTTPKITQSRLEMTLVRSGDRWLVSDIRAL